MSKILKSFGMTALLVALLAGTGMAGNDDSTIVSGDLKNTYTITAPADFDYGTFKLGDNNQTKDVAIAHNFDTNYDLQAASDVGKMTTGVNTLAHEMYLKAAGETALKLTTTGGVVKSNIGKPGATVSVDFGQHVLATDTVADNYAITVTFSAVAST